MCENKRWASREEAEKYAYKAFREGRTGLPFWAACDFLAWTAEKFNNIKRFWDSLYADWLISMGTEYIEEEIQNIKWEINTILFLENRNTKDSLKELEEKLQVAKSELKYIKSRKWR